MDPKVALNAVLPLMESVKDNARRVHVRLTRRQGGKADAWEEDCHRRLRRYCRRGGEGEVPRGLLQWELVVVFVSKDCERRLYPCVVFGEQLLCKQTICAIVQTPLIGHRILIRR
jgi:hypothetical protein